MIIVTLSDNSNVAADKTGEDCKRLFVSETAVLADHDLMSNLIQWD